MKIKQQDDFSPDMNMTPMIDVVFLLIIFFMLVTQFTQQILHGQIILPVAHQSMVDDPGKRMVINVDSEGKYFYMGQPYTKEQLQSRIMNYGRRKTMEYRGMQLSDMKVMIRADQGTPYKYIQNLYFLFQEATIWKICFATMKERA
jgi:biopolymer transport protein ExbD